MLSSKLSHPLTARELEIMRLLAKGLSLRAVKYYATGIHAKLGMRSHTAAIVWAWKHRAMRE